MAYKPRRKKGIFCIDCGKPTQKRNKHTVRCRECTFIYGNKWEQIKKKVIEHANNKCEICGEHKYLMAVHHIDCNRENNKIKNLSYLCYTCHKLLHQPMAGKGNYESGMKKLKCLVELDPKKGNKFCKPIFEKCEKFNTQYGIIEKMLISDLIKNT